VTPGRQFNLADLFEVVVDAVPDRLALVAGDQRRTYRQLDQRANRLAHHLAAQGVGPGHWVAIVSWNRVEWVESMLALDKLRAVPVNVNYRYVAAELRHVLDDAGVVTAIVEPGMGVAGLVIGDEYEAALAGQSPERDFGPRSPDDLYVLYTGGTTGLPKGVLWRSEDIFFAALGGGGFGRPPITEPDQLAQRVVDGQPSVTMVCPPMMHGGGQWMSFITFFGGGTVVLWTGRHFDAGEVWRTVEREGCTSIMIVGDAMARPLAEAAAAGRHDLSRVAVVGSGGAILSDAVRSELQAALPGAVIVDSFGASETGAGGSALGRAGFAMGPFMTVLDDDLRPVEPGSGRTGRLARRGHIPIGYHNDPGKTAATFVTDADGVRWVVPGDHAMVEADGTIVLLGRGSVCINTGGEKVFPEEVEAALKSHPDVYDAVVVGVADERYAERVAAVVKARPGTSPTLDALREHCRSRIAGYKLPRVLRLTDDIPRTAVGKPDYRWARDLLARRTMA
jgi:3-oxocholest-4-en-26-oate---CoA ligase